MARKILILMVVSFWALMTGLFVKKHYVSHRSAYTASHPVLLDPDYHMGIYHGQKRIGYFHFHAHPRDENPEKGYTLRSSLHLDYPAVGEAYIFGESLTDRELSLQSFHYYLRYKLKLLDEQDARLVGSLEDGKLLVKVKWGTYEKTFTIAAQEGIRLYDPITPWVIGGKFRPGQEYAIEVLNRFTRKPQLAKVRVLRSTTVSFAGKEIPVFEVETVVGDLKSVFRIGRNGKVYRMDSPLGFSLVREPTAHIEKEKI